MNGPAGVVIVAIEDGAADTIKPRVIAAGGDPKRILVLDTVPEGEGGERPLSLPEDVHLIERAVKRVGAKLVIIDPLMGFISAKLDPNKDRDVRLALTPLKILAEKTGAAVLIVRHLTKATDRKALYRGGSSIGIIGVARSGFLVAKHPNDEDRRVLASLKNNLAKPTKSLTFELVGADNDAVRVEWGEETSLGADDVAAPAFPEKHSALDEGKEFVREALKDGWMSSTQLDQDAKSAGISGATLRRAKKAVGVYSKKFGEAWWCALTEMAAKAEPNDQHDQQKHPTTQDEHLEHLEHPRVEERPPSSEDDQGDQGDQPPTLEQVARCIHDVPGACWLCRRAKT